MGLEPIHVLTMDRATSRLELTGINPTRQFMFVQIDPATGRWASSPALYWWQNGKWYDTGEQEITDLDSIPQKFRDEIEANPVTATVHGPTVAAVCKYCGDKRNQSDMEAHLVAHMDATLKAAGSVTAEPAPSTPEPEKADQNRHRRA
jgi:hypothetical protein